MLPVGTKGTGFMGIFRRVAETIRNQFVYIFRDSPSWAEFTSSSAGFLYCGLAVGSVVFLDKPPEMWPSMELATNLLDGRFWVIIAFSLSCFQMFAVFTLVRWLRATSCFVMLMWYMIVIFMAWPVVPWAPILAFPIALCIPNFFAIARHARDWGK